MENEKAVKAKEYHPRVERLLNNKDGLDTLLRAYDEMGEFRQNDRQEIRELRLLVMQLSDVISDLTGNLNTNTREYKIASEAEELIPDWAVKANNALMGWDDE